MDAPEAALSRVRLPLATATVLGAALLVHAIPAQDLLVYERGAIAQGELWRLMTGHWAHFSAGHLGANLLAFGLAGFIAEQRRERGFAWLCLVAPLAVGALLFALAPGLARYGGLSGVSLAAIAFVGVRGLFERGLWRWVCALALGVLGAKVLFELASRESLFAATLSGGAALVPEAHAAGALVGTLVAVLARSSVRNVRSPGGDAYGFESDGR